MFGIEIRHNLLNKGRGLFATKDFCAGDVIFTESPLVSAQFVWNAACRYLACNHCMQSLETAEQMCRRLSGKTSLELPHLECCNVATDSHVTCLNCGALYCSEKCQKESWQSYHQTLCINTSAPENIAHPLSRLLEAWKGMHYPPETCSIMLLVRMIATVKQSSNKPSLLQEYSKFCRATVNEEENIAHKLLGDQFQNQLEVIRSLLIEMFSDIAEVQQWLTPEGFRSLFALIGTNGQGIGTSSFSVWVKNCESLDLPGAEREQLDGLIDKLYLDIEEGNHSCCPNAEVTFPNNNFELSLKALEDIKAGEEIFISYLNECDIDRSRYSRQKILKENYLFICECSKCTQQIGDPDVTSEEEEDDDDHDHGECHMDC